MKETLEEAAEKLYPLLNVPEASNIDWAQRLGKREGFIEGAKWQQERIENESKQLINELESLVKHKSLGESYRAGITASIWRMKEWFELNKKK